MNRYGNPASAPRPRVMHCITRLGLGGAERVAIDIVRGLRDEFEPAIFTVHGQSGDEMGRRMESELADMDVPWFRGTGLPMKAGGPLPGAWALRRAIRRFNPDIVHCHAEPAEACAAVWRAMFVSGRSPALVRTIHNSMFWRFWPRIGGWCDCRLGPAHVACVSNATRAEFLRYRAASGARHPEREPVVIYNGVPVQRRQPRSAPHDPAVRRVLFAGRFEPEKGPDVLCRALPAVRLPSGCRGDISLIGRGRLERDVRELRQNPPEGWRVEIRPPVDNLPELMSGFDIVVVPSRFEGLGLICIEATLSGLPVIATDAPGLNETLPAGHPWLAACGDVPSLAARISDALRDVRRWVDVVSAAQEFSIARFSPEAMIGGYRRIYAGAIGGGTIRA